MQLRFAFNTLKHLFACCLLITGFALPLSAWAVDTDGDGYPDTAVMESFSSGGMPTGWIWVTPSVGVSSQSLVFACTTSNCWASVSKQTGSKIRYTWSRSSYGGSMSLLIDGSSGAGSCESLTATSWRCTTNLSPGTHTLKWTGKGVCPILGNCSAGLYGVYLDDIEYFIADNCPTVSNANQLDSDGDGVGDACAVDTDGDGIDNAIDTDDDNDGVGDTGDAFPLNATETRDTDNDGIGNNADLDDDNDGLLDGSDNCPVNSNADQLNTDGDTQGNACDTDDDNDGVADATDKFPLDATETLDTDNDGTGNNADTDDDSDGSLDVNDNCPINSNADQLNTDGDAQGDACDTDDDNDGVADSSDKFPLNIAASSDTDNDGFAGSWNAACDTICQNNSGLVLDNCPSNSNADQLNTDGDAQGNVCDTDDDSDGVLDTTDKFPLDATETLDTDNDGTGNNADTDDDNDTVLDVNDNCPLLASADQIDDDNDGVGNACDGDGPGKLDTIFNPGTGASDRVYSVALQADGKVLIGGNFTSYNGVARNCIARLNTDGSLDTSFNPGTGVTGTVMSVAPQTDGKVLIGGNFTTVNGVTRNYIARLNSDGSLDTSFNPGWGANNTVYSVALQADGKVLIGGYFTSYNGVSRNRIGRLNADGSLDTSFNPGTGANNTVISVVPQADGKVLIGGDFTTVQGVTHNSIARLNADGSLDTSFNPASGFVYSVVLQVDGKVLIGGTFTAVNGVARNCIARLNADGSLDTSFNPGTGASSDVYSVVLQADGKVLIGGHFGIVNGVPRSRIARLNSNGSLDTSFNPGTGASSDVLSVVAQADGKVLIGADFTKYNGTSISRIARIHTGDADQDGIEDAADYFSNNAATALDTDRDGLPDAWLQPNIFGCVASASSCNGLTLDNDSDNDGSLDINDNCPFNVNADQLNTDGDAQGNVCDTDDDNDGVLDDGDNCPVDSNVDQLNADGDAQGNACDLDNDNDGDLDSEEIAQGTDPLDPVSNSGVFTIVSFENGLPAGWEKPAAANVGWISDATQASHLTKSLRTAATGNSQKAQVQMTAYFSGTSFSFDVKVSTESNYDNFRVYVDGTSKVTMSGSFGWQTITVPITGGTHTINFEYLKDGNIAGGSDAVWIDRFSYSNGDVDNDGQTNVVDLDDDNDGAPDYLDPEPLNPANSSVWPLNNNYQGSAVNESQTVQ